MMNRIVIVIVALSLIGSLVALAQKNGELNAKDEQMQTVLQAQHAYSLEKQAARDLANAELIKRNKTHEQTNEKLATELEGIRRQDKEWRDNPLPTDTADRLRKYTSEVGLRPSGGHPSGTSGADTRTSTEPTLE